MAALETLTGVVSNDQMNTWRSMAKSIVPTWVKDPGYKMKLQNFNARKLPIGSTFSHSKAYRGWPHAGGNWAIVALTGEFLRSVSFIECGSQVFLSPAYRRPCLLCYISFLLF